MTVVTPWVFGWRWPTDSWQGLGTGVVSGLITGLVAFGLFYFQRRVDKQDARDDRTLRAIESIRRVTQQTITLCAEAQPLDLPPQTFIAWGFAAQLEHPRVGSQTVRELIDISANIATEATMRLHEIEAAYPDQRDRDGMVGTPDERLTATGDVISAAATFLGGVNESLSMWSPDRREIPRSLAVDPVLVTPFDPNGSADANPDDVPAHDD